MTSLFDGWNFDLIVLLFFWAVAVVALALSATAQLRERGAAATSEHFSSSPSRPGIVVPLHRLETWLPGTRRHNRGKSRTQGRRNEAGLEAGTVLRPAANDSASRSTSARL